MPPNSQTVANESNDHAPCLLAIDWGSQSVRAALFDLNGVRLTLATTALDAASPGHHDAEYCQQLLFQTIRQAARRLSGCMLDVRAVAICAQRSGLVAIDPGHCPLSPVLYWNDAQVSDLAPSLPWWVRLGAVFLRNRERLNRLINQAPSNRLRCHHASVWHRAGSLLPWSAFLNWCLNGQAADGISGATGIYPFDFRRRRWRPPRHWTWNALSLAPRQLPKLFPAATKLGRILPHVATMLDLPAHVEVIAAGADKACEALGAGVCEMGDIHISLGTAISVAQLTSKARGLGRLQPAYPAIQDNYFLLEWQLDHGMRIVRQLADYLPATGKTQEQPSESILDASLAACPPGAEGLLCYPRHYPDTLAGVFPGLLAASSLARIYRAMIEGMAATLRQAVDRIEARGGVQAKRILVSGGGSRSRVIVQLLSDVLGRTLERTVEANCGLRGAALCAAKSQSWIENWHETKSWTSSSESLSPEPKSADEYDQWYAMHWRQQARKKEPFVETRPAS